MVWGSFLIAVAALKTPTRNGYNAQGVRVRVRINPSTETLLRPWSQQARLLTPRGETVAHLGNQGCCAHMHTGNLSVVQPRGNDSYLARTQAPPYGGGGAPSAADAAYFGGLGA